MAPVAVVQRGIENITRLKQDAFNLARIQFAPELLLLEQNMKSQDSLVNTAKASMEDKRKQFEATAMANMGFLNAIKHWLICLHEEASVLWASLLISMLIILIEIGPVLSKLMMPLGPYDIALGKRRIVAYGK